HVPVLRRRRAPELPAVPAQRRHLPRRAVQHRQLRAADPHGGAGLRPGVRRFRAHPGRRAPVLEPLRAGARAAVAPAARAAGAAPQPRSARPVRLHLRRHRDRRLRAPPRDQGPGGGVSVLVLLAALDRGHAIGKDNALPWHLPADLKRFKALTLGKPLLMGRRTAESLRRALPGRRDLVRTPRRRVPYEGLEAVASCEQALAIARADAAPQLCVIGGREVFSAALRLAALMHLPWVDTEVQGTDAFFPRFDASPWRVVSREPHAADERHAFAFEFVDY